jgi:hypothetical protein
VMMNRPSGHSRNYGCGFPRATKAVATKAVATKLTKITKDPDVRRKRNRVGHPSCASCPSWLILRVVVATTAVIRCYTPGRHGSSIQIT